MNLKRIASWKGVFILAILFALTAEFLQHVAHRTAERQIEHAQEKLTALEMQMASRLETIATFNTDSQYHEFLIHANPLSSFSFFIFEKNTLRHWSDNETELPENFIASNQSVVHLQNGIFEVFKKESGTKSIVGLLLLRKEYSYENKYLQNHFNPELGLTEDVRLAETSGAYQLRSSSGKVLLSLDRIPAVPDHLPFLPTASFYLVAFVLFFVSVVLYFLQRSLTLTAVFIAGAFLFLVRLAMISFRLHGELYYNDFFSPKIYASSFLFNSLGDFFLNAVTFYCFGTILYHFSKQKKNGVRRTSLSWVYLIAAIIFLIILFRAMHGLLRDFVLNSKIPFDTSITNLDFNSVVAACIVLLTVWSFFLLAAGILNPFRTLFIIQTHSNTPHPFRTGLLVLLCISLYATFIIDSGLKDRKVENQQLFAERLDSRRDPLAEYLFADLQKRMTKDTAVFSMLSKSNRDNDNLLRYLQQYYFNGYFSKFDLSIDVIPFLSSSKEKESDSLSVFKQQFAGGKQTSVESLKLMPDESGRLKYFSLIHFTDSGSTADHYIALTLMARFTQLAEGFPELLVSSSVVRNRDESAYSYARYSNGALIYAGGTYPYAFHSTMFEKNAGEFASLKFDGYEHVVYSPSPGSLVVVSRPAGSFFDTLSLFSYVLLFFLSLFLFCYGAKFFFTHIHGFHLTLKQRIRTSIISLVVVSFVLIAIGTSVYIIRKYDADKNRTILSRLNAMWFGITDHFSIEHGLSNEIKNDWNATLNDLVSNFNLDFNLYDESGNLFYSSQPKLFEKGILSKRINPEAFYEMRQFGRTQYVHTESIGTLKFASAYAPFTNKNGVVAGYLNLPYFEKQNELNKEIGGFLSALINIYLLLLGVALLLALFITSRITKPLLLIQERLRQVKLGSRNEIIEWKRNDEIGQLVQQYNSMVDALAESADKLSRSERESAWREMAQQVAHEIKNPLTPMKLSVQHLQRAWKEKSGNLDELFQRISQTLIEQIDTLSNIAGAFGDFARMPKTRNESLSLNEVISSSMNLFNETPGIELKYDDDGVLRSILADRDQLIRAFSNIIKNAIQSIPSDRKGLIQISVSTMENTHVVSIADNGAGIPGALQGKIFTPNFTTKSSGMGLGLAMVKSTVESAGGSIRFETKENVGSVFTISLPKK